MRAAARAQMRLVRGAPLLQIFNIRVHASTLDWFHTDHGMILTSAIHVWDIDHTDCVCACCVLLARQQTRKCTKVRSPVGRFVGCAACGCCSAQSSFEHSCTQQQLCTDCILNGAV